MKGRGCLSLRSTAPYSPPAGLRPVSSLRPRPAAPPGVWQPRRQQCTAPQHKRTGRSPAAPGARVLDVVESVGSWQHRNRTTRVSARAAVASVSGTAVRVCGKEGLRVIPHMGLALCLHLCACGSGDGVSNPPFPPWGWCGAEWGVWPMHRTAPPGQYWDGRTPWEEGDPSQTPLRPPLAPPPLLILPCPPPPPQA